VSDNLSNWDTKLMLVGQYKFYAIQLPSLADVTGFPVSVEGHAANNDPTR